MRPVLITQRVEVDAIHGERRDALDQRWPQLVQRAGLSPVLVPNNRAWINAYLATGVDYGLLLTGGNSLVRCGGHAPERDEIERLLLIAALDRGTPVLGVCRGMQVIIDHFGGELEPVTGHVTAAQEIAIRGNATVVNSYHDWGTKVVPQPLQVWATAPDGVVKAVRHESQPVWGIMWHPERFEVFRADDLTLLQQVFGGEAVV